MGRYEDFTSQLLLLIVKHLLPGSVRMSIPPADLREVSEINSNSMSLLAMREVFAAIDGNLTEENIPDTEEGAAQEFFDYLLKDPVLYSQLTRAIAEPLLTCYYQRPEVLLGLGLDNTAPFPQGNVLKQSDLSMLEPVYLRGSIYREVDEA